MKNIIITGGAGFIGSHVVRLFVNKYSEYRIINVDVLTYAGNLENLSDIESAPNYVFERVDIVDAAAVDTLFDKYQPEGVIHLAAESHVDRSIKDPLAFVRTNILGTVNLLNSFKRIHKDFEGKRFYHISTDEVYGTLGKEGLFEETTPYDPNSPYMKPVTARTLDDDTYSTHPSIYKRLGAVNKGFFQVIDRQEGHDAMSLYLKGGDAFDQQNYYSAIRYFEASLEIIELPLNWEGLGQSHLQLEHYEKALACFSIALEFGLDYDILYDKGVSLWYLNRKSDACDCWKTCYINDNQYTNYVDFCN